MPLEELVAAILDVDVSLLSDESSPASVDGWDSLVQVSLVSAVEETYGVTLTTADMRSAYTLGDFRSILSAKGVAV